MAIDMFLILKDIPGESKDKVHNKSIDVLAWSWGLSQSGTFHMGGGGGSGKANFQDLSITKYVDKSSMTLMGQIASGKHIETASLIIRKAGGDAPLEYIKYDLTKVMVTSLSTGGSGGEDQLTENITLNFAEVSANYMEQDDKGAKVSVVPFTWNIATNSSK
jgi:type VI secretion system secreted protein Hcp